MTDGELRGPEVASDENDVTAPPQDAGITPSTGNEAPPAPDVIVLPEVMAPPPLWRPGRQYRDDAPDDDAANAAPPDPPTTPNGTAASNGTTPNASGTTTEPNGTTPEDTANVHAARFGARSSRRQQAAAPPDPPQSQTGEIPCDQGNEVCANLREISEEVRPHDAMMADRMISLSRATIANQPTDGWESVNIFDVINPDRIANVIRTETLRSRGIGVLELIRNVLVLFPIMLTWFSLWVALKSYASAVTQGKVQAGEPFLMLWQSGFSGVSGPLGLAGTLTLGHVAFWDAIFIFVIVVLTAIIHWKINVRQAGREAVILRLDHRLRDALWGAARRISRSTTPAGQYDKLYEMARQLVAQIAAERERIGLIATERETELNDFTAGMRAFHEGTTEIAKGADRVAASMEELQDALNATVERDQQLVKGLQDFSATGQRQVDLLLDQNVKIDASTRMLSDAARVMAETAIASNGRAADLADKVTVISKKILESQQDERASHDRQRELIEYTSTAVESLKNAAENATKGAQSFEESVRSLNTISVDAKAIQNALTQSGKQIDKSETSLATLTGQMSNAVQSVDTAAATLREIARSQQASKSRRGPFGRRRNNG